MHQYSEAIALTVLKTVFKQSLKIIIFDGIKKNTTALAFVWTRCIIYIGINYHICQQDAIDWFEQF